MKVYKSLVLCHLRYSSTTLVSCPDYAKSEMQAFQNKLLRIIGISREAANLKYSILDVSDFVASCSSAQVTRILNASTHSLPLSLTNVKRVTHSTFQFTIPTAWSDKFACDAVMLALHQLERVANASRRPPQQLPPLPLQPTQPQTIESAKGSICPNAWCKRPAHLWLFPDLHKCPRPA